MQGGGNKLFFQKESFTPSEAPNQKTTIEKKCYSIN
jgi:hypothetical protein